MTWEENKRRAFERMREDIEIGYMDNDIIELIEKFFQLPYAYTKSSCSGRIVAVDSKFPWSREGTIVFKVHRPLEINELKNILEIPVQQRLWINAMGPIIHVITKDFESAMRILSIARDAGFKHSGILTTNEEGWVVELTTGVRANILAKVGNKVVLNEEHLERVCNVINEVLLEGKKKLKELEARIDEELKALRGTSPS